MIKREKGITLIALVITIIVLLILAGVSIAMLTGNNGILTQASNAKEKTTKAEEEEKIKMAVMGSSISEDGFVERIEETSFKNELKNQFGNQELDVVVNGDGSFIITVKDTNRKYYVNDDKTVINSDNIIEIGTAEELASFRDEVNNGNSYEGKAVLLTSDITLSGNWTPIGYYDEVTEETHNFESETNKPFKGIFDGGNNKIDGITISNDKIANGLFGLVIEGTIRNITIGVNSNISGNAKTAGVVGILYGINGNISNCTNYATILGGNGTAGIVGAIIGQHTIYNCKNYGEITGMGGIVGASNGYGGWVEQFENYFHKIINCGNYGSITRGTKGNGDYCGGIAGYFNGQILNCCNKGDIQGGTRYTGGVAGNVAGSIENSYNLNNVSGQNYVAGILGVTAPPSPLINSTINCYFLGDVSGTGERIGDIVGLEYEGITNCYTKDDTFTAADLGDAFKDDTNNINGGYPLLYWE